MNPIEDLIHEHKAIKVMLSIMNKIAENIRNDKSVDTNDIESIIDFLKIFADKCHHGKEENALFPALVEAGIPKEGGPVGVMLREHADFFAHNRSQLDLLTGKELNHLL